MFDSYLTITINNPTNSPGKWVAFSYDEGLKSSPGISVGVSQSSLAQATRESADHPFVVTEIKVHTSSDAQMLNPITIRNKEYTGPSDEQQFTPADFEDPNYKTPNFIKITDPKIKIKGQTALEGTINAKSKMTLILEIKPETKISSFIDSVLSLFKPGTKMTISGFPSR